MKKPEPIHKYIVCSTCGLEWEKHGPKPTLEKCVELLKAELAKRPVFSQSYQNLTGTASPAWPLNASGIPLKSFQFDVGKAA